MPHLLDIADAVVAVVLGVIAERIGGNAGERMAGNLLAELWRRPGRGPVFPAGRAGKPIQRVVFVLVVRPDLLASVKHNLMRVVENLGDVADRVIPIMEVLEEGITDEARRKAGLATGSRGIAMLSSSKFTSSLGSPSGEHGIVESEVSSARCVSHINKVLKRKLCKLSLRAPRRGVAR